MLRKLTATMLATFLIVFTPGMRARATNNTVLYRSGEYGYILLENGTAEITSYDGHASELAVPAYLDGYAVTRIGEQAFLGCSGLISLVLPEGVSVIGTGAFYNCSGLSDIVLPQSVRKIGSGAFYGCSNLTEAVIPPSVTIIEDYTFQMCKSLTNVIIPEGVTVIGLYVFLGCESLTQLVLPESLKMIEAGAFLSCAGLASMNIPENVTRIGDQAFDQCPNLVLTVPRGTIADEYVVANNIPFVYLGDSPIHEEAAGLVHVADLAELFTAETITYLEMEMSSLYESHGIDILLLTTADTVGGNAPDYAVEFYEKFREFADDSPDAIIFSIHMDLMEYHELTSGLGDVVTTATREQELADLIIPYLGSGAFGDGMMVYLDNIRSIIMASK